MRTCRHLLTLSLDLSVTNLTNADAVTSRNRASTVGYSPNTANGLSPSNSYNTVTGLQAPRATNLYLRYSF